MSVLFAFGLAVCAIMIGLLLGMLIGYFGERRHCRRMEARAEHEQRAWLASPKSSATLNIRRAVNPNPKKIEPADYEGDVVFAVVFLRAPAQVNGH